MDELDNMSPNTVGEILREKFYNPNLGLGCYMNFEVRPEVKKLPDIPIPWVDFSNCVKADDKPKIITDQVDPESPELYQVYELSGIKMLYHWDGDGTLIFILPSGKILINNDCKKTYRWEWCQDWETLHCFI